MGQVESTGISLEEFMENCVRKYGIGSIEIEDKLHYWIVHYYARSEINSFKLNIDRLIRVKPIQKKNVNDPLAVPISDLLSEDRKYKWGEGFESYIAYRETRNAIRVGCLREYLESFMRNRMRYEQRVSFLCSIGV